MPHLWQAFPKVQRAPTLHINQTSSKQEDEINMWEKPGPFLQKPAL